MSGFESVVEEVAVQWLGELSGIWQAVQMEK
jgi:hypothetical protein